MASANLAKVYDRILSSSSGIPDNSYVGLFVRFHARLHQAIDVNTKAAKLCWRMGQKLTSEIATETLTCSELVQMVAITVYQLRQVQPVENGQAEDSTSTDEKLIRSLLLESLAGLLNSLLLPVYTLKADGNMTR